MALLGARFRPGGGAARRTVWLAVSALPLALAACTPTIEAYRSVAGVDKNDPDPQKAPFTHNMAEADVAPYPNLANVPPPPTRATSNEERLKLTQGLVADRTATEALGQAPPPSPAPTTASPAAAKIAAATIPPAAPPTTAAPTPPRAPTPPSPAPPPAVAVPPPAASPAPSPPVAASASPVQPASPPAAAVATAAPPAAKVAANATTPSGPRKGGEPPDPVAQDSTFEMPAVRSIPEPEAFRPGPPAPSLPAVPRPAVLPQPSAALVAAVPEAAPPVPVLTPVAAPPAAAKPEPKHPAAAAIVATLNLPATAAPLGRDQAEINRVAALYPSQPGAVRVVGYAAAPAAGSDPLTSYRTALERAQAVAKALAVAGIPAAKIQSEAAPALGPQAVGRIEIQFVP